MWTGTQTARQIGAGKLDRNRQLSFTPKKYTAVRHKDKQTERKTDKHTTDGYRQTDRQTDRQTTEYILQQELACAKRRLRHDVVLVLEGQHCREVFCHTDRDVTSRRG